MSVLSLVAIEYLRTSNRLILRHLALSLHVIYWHLTLSMSMTRLLKAVSSNYRLDYSLDACLMTCYEEGFYKRQEV